ncbi:MAG TPA: tetratricopeptide repeat protein, partial [Leptolyngbyaceae cyanobacterium]
MTRKQPAFLRGSRIVIFLILLLCTAVLPPTLAYTTAENSIIQNLSNAQQLVQQGKKFYDAEQFTGAIALLQQAVNSFKASEDKLNQAMALSNLSLAYQQLGQWDKAEDAIASSLNLLGYSVKKRAGGAGGAGGAGAEIQNLQVLAQALDIQGRLQLAQGKTELALTTWRQAANIYVKLKDYAGLTRNQINQAQALQTLGHYRQAQKTLTQVQQSLQKQPNSDLKATGLRSLGNVYRVVGNLKTSHQVLEESLDVAKQLHSSQAIADTLLSLGNTVRAQKDTQAALKFYQQAANAS